MKNQKFLMVMFSIGLFPFLAVAQGTLYVHPGGIDDGNPCRESSFPCETITWALLLASVGDTIQLADGYYTESLIIDKEISIQGESEERTIIQAAREEGEATDRVITVKGEKELSLSTLTVRYGKVEGDRLSGVGGGLYIANSILNLDNVTFYKNSTSEGQGGAVYSNSCSGVFRDVSFIENESGKDGGGFYGRVDAYDMENLSFENNIAYESGGGYYQYSSENDFSQLTFRGNTAMEDGGGMVVIALRNGITASDTLIDFKFIGNSASKKGGGFYIDQARYGVIVMDSVNFENNTAAEGGGMYQENGGNYMSNLFFSDNTADFGGGYYNFLSVSSSTLPVPAFRDTEFINNTAKLAGGAVYLKAADLLYFINTDFIRNTSEGTAEELGGGAASVQLQSRARFYNCEFEENHSNGLAGAVLLGEDNFTTRIYNCLLYKNTADGDGGGIYATRSRVNIYNSTMFENISQGRGGAVRIKRNYGKATGINSIFWGNKAMKSGNEVYVSSGAVEMDFCLYDNEDGDIVGSGFSASNSLDGDPRFKDPVNGNLHLSKGSPAIDFGSIDTDESWFVQREGTPIDLDGDKRFINGRVDLGPYEFDPEVGIVNNFKVSEITAYPNPVDNTLQIESRFQIDKLELINPLGTILLNKECKSKSAELKVSDIPPGYYFLRVGLRQGFKTIKIIVN